MSTYEKQLVDNLLLPIDKNGDMITLTTGTMIELVMDLKYNLRDKLLIAKNIGHDKHVDIRNLLSSRDIKIIEEFRSKNPEIKDVNLKFMKKLSSNIIEHKNQLSQNITALIKNLDNSELDNSVKHDMIYKWVGLGNISAEKIKTIIDGKLYLVKPTEFNDRFDCQLHPSKSFAEGIKNTMDKPVEFFNLLTFEACLATSFTLRNPLSSESSHMWGLYGNQGNGIVVSYDINTYLINVLSTLKGGIFDLIEYSRNYNIGNVFRGFLEDSPLETKSKALKTLMFSKSITWEHEKELRLVVGHRDTLLKVEDFKKNEYTEDDFNVIRNKFFEELKNNQNIDFIIPSEIILGWSIDKSNDIEPLLSFAEQKSIKVFKLDGSINYDNNKFSYD